MHFKRSVIKNETVITDRDWTYQEELPNPEFPDLPDSEPIIIDVSNESEAVVSPRLLAYLLSKVKELSSG